MNGVVVSVAIAMSILWLTVSSQDTSKCLSVVTFNAQLAYNVKDIRRRKARILERLPELQEDFICVQEVIFREDVVDLVRQVEDTFPYHYSYLHDDVSKLNDFPPTTGGNPDMPLPAPKSACSSLLQCVAQSCSTFFTSSTWEAIACLTQSCYIRNTIGPDCISCVAQHTFNSSLQQALDRCDPSSGKDVRMNHPGLVVLSRLSLSDVFYSSFFPGSPMLIQRGYISANVASQHIVLCAHTSHEFDLYYEALPFKTYTEQQVAEIDILDSHGGTKDIIAGDFNTGPSVDDITPDKNLSGELKQNYYYLLSLGFWSPYADNDGRCSTCSDNTDGKAPTTLKDHVLIRGDSLYSSSQRRVLDSWPPVSEHYGIVVDVCVSSDKGETLEEEYEEGVTGSVAVSLK